MNSTASSLLARLRSHKAVVSAEGSHLRVEAPKGVLTDQLRQDLRRHKIEILAFLERREQLLGMTLDEFARSRYRAELRMPGCSQTMWWVPLSLDADTLMQQGITRGRVWTTEELRRAWELAGHSQEHVQAIVQIKVQMGCELTSIDLGDGEDPS